MNSSASAWSVLWNGDIGVGGGGWGWGGGVGGVGGGGWGGGWGGVGGGVGWGVGGRLGEMVTLRKDIWKIYQLSEVGLKWLIYFATDLAVSSKNLYL